MGRIVRESVWTLLLATTTFGVSFHGCRAARGPDDAATLRVVGSCALAGTIEISLDGGRLGSIGGASADTFSVEPGVHTLSACSRYYAWSTGLSSLERGQTLELALTC